MLRVLHTIDTTGPGGAESVFVALATRLDPQVTETVAAIPGPGWVADQLGRSGVKTLYVPSRGRFNIPYLASLVRIIKQHDINMVQSHLLGSNLYASLAGFVTQVPVISTFHGFADANTCDRFLSLKSRIINIGSRRIVFVSNHLREHFIRNYRIEAGKAVTIYNGIDTKAFRPDSHSGLREKLGLDPNHVLVGAVGNVRPAKGYEYLIRAARIVLDRLPACRFLVAGEATGPLRCELDRLIQEAGLDRKIFFLGHCPDVPRVMNSLDLFVLPSLTEGFSIATLEAMASDVPVVATRSGGPEEIIEDRISGLLVAPGSASCLAEGILKLLEDKDLRRRCIRGGRQVLGDSFLFNHMLDSYLALYHGSRASG